MKLSDFDYSLPPNLIAQHPVEPRDAARLLVVDRSTGRLEHRVFRDLPEYLQPADVMVVNNTRVIPARLRARKPTGGAVEVLLLRPAREQESAIARPRDDQIWEVLLRPGRRVRIGTRLHLSPRLSGVVVGPSAVRTLETVAADGGAVRPGRGWSELFMYPGYRFRATDVLITNFHLPKTTLLMLVCAFAGRDLILRAYQEAIAEEYRFYSFGDAMLIL